MKLEGSGDPSLGDRAEVLGGKRLGGRGCRATFLATPAHVHVVAWIWAHCMRSERSAPPKKRLEKAKIWSQPDRPIQSMVSKIRRVEKARARLQNCWAGTNDLLASGRTETTLPDPGL